MFPLPEKWTTIAYIYFYIYLYLARTKEVSHLFVFFKKLKSEKKLSCVLQCDSPDDHAHS